MKTFVYKIIYHPRINIILRNILFPIGKLIGKPLISVSGKINLKVSNTKFQLLTNQTCSVTQDLFYNGAEKYEFTLLFQELIKNSKVFLDIGSNIGFFAILAGKLNSNTKVFAIEPGIGALHYLKMNVDLNNLKDQVHIIDKAISDSNETLEFYVVNNNKYPWLTHTLNGSNSLQNQYGLQKNESYPVEVITIKELMKIHNIKQIDLIKIDTECTEHLILMASLNEINTFRPIIISEVYEMIRDDFNYILDKLENYELYQISNNKLILLSSFSDSIENEYNYLFMPIEKKTQYQKLFLFE